MSEKKRPQNGKFISTPAELSSGHELLRPSPELRIVLSKVYDAFQKLDDSKLNALCREDFVFHMTDWLRDLQQLNHVYSGTTAVKTQEASDAVYGFLIHAVPHLMAAGRLLEGKELTHSFKYPWEGPYEEVNATRKRSRSPAPSP